MIKFLNFKKLGVYEDTPELLSVSLGSNETTLLKLTTAYSSFINGGKKVNPKVIKRIQDKEGKQFITRIKEFVRVAMYFLKRIIHL